MRIGGSKGNAGGALTTDEMMALRCGEITLKGRYPMPRISRLQRNEVLPSAVTIYDRYLQTVEMCRTFRTMAHRPRSSTIIAHMESGAEYRDPSEGAEGTRHCADVAVKSHTLLPSLAHNDCAQAGDGRRRRPRRLPAPGEKLATTGCWCIRQRFRN
jgi:hypothetical protein